MKIPENPMCTERLENYKNDPFQNGICALRPYCYYTLFKSGITYEIRERDSVGVHIERDCHYYFNAQGSVNREWFLERLKTSSTQAVLILSYQTHPGRVQPDSEFLFLWSKISELKWKDKLSDSRIFQNKYYTAGVEKESLGFLPSKGDNHIQLNWKLWDMLVSYGFETSTHVIQPAALLGACMFQFTATELWIHR